MNTDEQHEGRHHFKKIAPQMWRVWSTDDDGGEVDVRDYYNVHEAMADFLRRANLQA
jgi:hypothetical protein